MVWCTPAEVLARPAAERAEWFMPEAADECLDSLRLGNNSTSISDCLRIKLDEKDPGASLPAAKGMLCNSGGAACAQHGQVPCGFALPWRHARCDATCCARNRCLQACDLTTAAPWPPGCTPSPPSSSTSCRWGSLLETAGGGCGVHVPT